MPLFHVYILRSTTTGRRYVGSCENVDERIRRHNLGHSKATRHSIPWILVHIEPFLLEPKRQERNGITNRGEVAMNSIVLTSSAVAAATGRGFESRRPERFLATDLHR